ncbi:hypothetical protein ACN1C3_23895 [Pseudomonas sp. H11T01]|uniref:hypothetical protein n=1 Tax=Pseudomonas sp. H11T01 TaxID=3402749 RepID=UPI003AD0A800
MTRLTGKQLHDIADWCRERQMLPDRITGSDVSAACRSLGIAQDGEFDLYEIKEIGSLCEAE